jgi:hypothetical protein
MRRLQEIGNAQMSTQGNRDERRIDFAPKPTECLETWWVGRGCKRNQRMQHVRIDPLAAVIRRFRN